MPHYLVEVSYKDTAVKAMVSNPQDRSAPVRKMVESLGGKMHSFFFSFGDFDIVTILELPGNQTAAAISMAVGSTGGFSKYRTTVLMTPDEAMQAMRDANRVSYSPPG